MMLYTHVALDDRIICDAPILRALTIVLSLPCLKGGDKPPLGLGLATV